MTETSPRPVSAVLLVGAYLASFIIMIVLLWLIYGLVEQQFGFAPENSAMGVIVSMCAGMMVGHTWYAKAKERPTSGAAWRIALICAVLTTGLQVGLAVLFLSAGLLADLIPARGVSGDEVMAFAAIMAGAFVLQLLLIRWGISTGAKQSAKGAELRAARQTSKA